MSILPFTREFLEKELAEKTADLRAFSRAREIVRNRVLEVKDSTSPITPLPNWSGTDAVLGSLDLAIHAMERTIMELNVALTQAPPRFTVIDGGEA
jgi:hypothetical protein